jgi:hypothetical protein
VIPERQTSEVPGTARIECHYDTCPGLSWEGPAIDSEPRRFAATIDSGLGLGVLTIDPLNVDDDGEYFCTCAGGRRTGPSNLIVNRKLTGLKVIAICS